MRSFLRPALRAMLCAFMCLVALLAAPQAAMAADTLSEAEVRQFIQQGDQLVMQHNIGKLVSLLAPEAKIQVQDKTYTRNTWATRLRQQYSALPADLRTSYRTQVDAVKVSGARATVNSTVYERLMAGGKSISSVHKEAVTLEKRGGYILITSVKAYNVSLH